MRWWFIFSDDSLHGLLEQRKLILFVIFQECVESFFCSFQGQYFLNFRFDCYWILYNFWLLVNLRLILRRLRFDDLCFPLFCFGFALREHALEFILLLLHGDLSLIISRAGFGLLLLLGGRLFNLFFLTCCFIGFLLNTRFTYIRFFFA